MRFIPEGVSLFLHRTIEKKKDVPAAKSKSRAEQGLELMARKGELLRQLQEARVANKTEQATRLENELFGVKSALRRMRRGGSPQVEELKDDDFAIVEED